MTSASIEPAFSAERQRSVAAALNAALPAGCVLSALEDTRPYECDGLSAYRQPPMVQAICDEGSGA
jgi:glycolate oxidase